MAALVSQWFCSELSKLGIEATEDVAKHILNMQDAEELEKYMLNWLDSCDPGAVRAFLPKLIERWQSLGGKPPPNAKIYRKNEEAQVYVERKSKKRKEKNRNPVNSETFDRSVTALKSGEDNIPKGLVTNCTGVNGTSLQNGSTLAMSSGVQEGQGARRKNKFVPLYSQEGKEKLVIRIPGRTQCECQALKHKLINNCTHCGRVVCEQEGAGPCLFCGHLVCTPEDQEVLSRNSNKSEKLRQFLMRDADKFIPLNYGSGDRDLLASVSTRLQEGLQKATQHKDKLIEYDRTSVRRTQVIDDECDYFTTDSKWLSKNDREALRKREEELRAIRYSSRHDKKVTFDFAGRRVVEEENIVGKTMYDCNDAVIQQVHYQPCKVESADPHYTRFLVNPSIQQQAPQFVTQAKPDISKIKIKMVPDQGNGKGQPRPPVIQDRELCEMSDDGMCLSMHQPWASLLIAGIKIHEGRSWYTAHRGRLWIAATAKSPSKQEISELEDHYQFILKNENIEFPHDYPVGCLLGCVDLVDCISQEDYQLKFPDGESASPYVFICQNPQQLVVRFPIKGKHKIYKLESTIHQAAKKGLR